MKFPLVSDIASTSVVHVNIDETVAHALDAMLNENHRNVIVIDKECFRILTVMDVVGLRNNTLDLDIKLSELDLTIVPVIEKHKNILDTLEFLHDSSEYICVINPDKTLYGLITHTDITSNIDPDSLMDNYRLSDFLKIGAQVKWADPQSKTTDLLRDMAEDFFDNIIVLEDKKPVGILTTKDVMKLIKEQSDLSLSISHYMSAPIETIDEDASVKEALQFVKRKHYKRVVVVDAKGRLSGIITQKELISLTFSKWVSLMKEYQEELSEINSMLEEKNREYEALASTDSLTGLYNRYKFSELYLSAYTTMIQRRNAISIIMLDIDYFKKVNDTYGHNIGDYVLVQVSHTLLRTLRSVDIICRWGGEEFIVLLPTVSLDDAYKLAQKLRATIENLSLEKVDTITASFGVSEVKEGDIMEDAIDRADRALYLAKNSGRNCVKTQKDLT